MDKKEQEERIMRLINKLAMKAIALPAGDRTAFVNSEIDSMKRDYLRTYSADPEMLALSLNFAEKMRKWGLTLTGIFEMPGGKAGPS